jgi:hypothetical protein
MRVFCAAMDLHYITVWVWIMLVTRIWIQIVTLIQIQILLVTLMRIRILLVTLIPNPDPACPFDPDPDSGFQIKAQNLEKCSNWLIFAYI